MSLVIYLFLVQENLSTKGKTITAGNVQLDKFVARGSWGYLREDSTWSSSAWVLVSTPERILERDRCREVKAIYWKQSTHLRGNGRWTRRSRTQEFTINHCYPSWGGNLWQPIVWFIHLPLAGSSVSHVFFLVWFLRNCQWCQVHDGSDGNCNADDTVIALKWAKDQVPGHRDYLCWMKLALIFLQL